MTTPLSGRGPVAGKQIRGRLSKEERALLHMAAQFVLAGEWPFEAADGGEMKSDDEIERERAVLKRGAEKLWRMWRSDT